MSTSECIDYIQKRGGDKIAAGVFTQPYTTPKNIVVDALEQACENRVLKQGDITLDVLEGFMSKFGRAFCGVGSLVKALLVKETEK